MLGSKLNGILSALAPASENLVMLVMLGWKTWPERCASYTAFNCYYSVWKLLLSGAYSRFMPLVVLYGSRVLIVMLYSLITEHLFEAALGELSVGARSQPSLNVGDFNVEPTNILCLLRGISAELWVDMEAAWAGASGVDPAVTCKPSWNAMRGLFLLLLLFGLVM